MVAIAMMIMAKIKPRFAKDRTMEKPLRTAVESYTVPLSWSMPPRKVAPKDMKTLIIRFRK